MDISLPTGNQIADDKIPFTCYVKTVQSRTNVAHRPTRAPIVERVALQTSENQIPLWAQFDPKSRIIPLRAYVIIAIAVVALTTTG